MTTTALSLADFIYLAAAIVAVGGGSLGLYRGAMKIYRQTAGSRRDLARRLNQLGAGVTVRWVEDRFGTPAFARAFAPAGVGQVAGLAPMRELVYRSRHAWLQILANEHDAVVRFSITVTDPRFGFQVEHLTNGQLKVRLGRGSFADINAWGKPGGRNLRIGAHNREYAEAYWFGNPGNYQWYVVSHNDAGTGAFRFSLEREGPAWVREGVLKFSDPPVGVLPFDADAPYALKFRAGTIVNTLTVLGPLQKTEVLTESRGADSNQVRVLVPGVRQRWKIRRRIRRLMRQAEMSARAPDTRSEHWSLTTAVNGARRRAPSTRGAAVNECRFAHRGRVGRRCRRGSSRSRRPVVELPAAQSSRTTAHPGQVGRPGQVKPSSPGTAGPKSEASGRGMA